MPLTFINGGGPNFSGVICNNSSSLLTNIQDSLLAAGWTTSSDQISSNSRLVMQGNSSNNHQCFIIFWCDSNNIFHLQGATASNLQTLSPDLLTTTFTLNANNRMWITADDDSGAICIRNVTGESKGFHFGFLDRVDLNDPWLWMVGEIRTTQHNVWWSKAPSDVTTTTFWHNQANDFFNSSNPFFTGNNLVSLLAHTTADRYTTGCRPGFQGVLGTATESQVSFGFGDYGAYSGYGAINPVDNKAYIDTYYYLPGFGPSHTAFNHPTLKFNSTLAIPARLNFKGLVKHVNTGLASLEACSQVSIIATNRRYLSVGSRSWQGMRIA